MLFPGASSLFLLFLWCSLAFLSLLAPPCTAQNFTVVALASAFPEGAPLAVTRGGLAWADVNQDSHLDLFVFGDTATYEYYASLYLNNGNGSSFSDITGRAFPDNLLPGFFEGQVKWADVNQDSFPDLLLQGKLDRRAIMEGPFGQLLLNNQGSNFSLLLSFASFSDHQLQWGDFDGDHFLDMIQIQNNGFVAVHLNDGNQPTTFTSTPVNSFAAHGGTSDIGEIRAADFDGDGDDDMLIVLGGYSLLVRSNGDGSFVDATGGLIAENSGPVRSVTDSSADWGDVNGDQRLDFVVCGQEVGMLGEHPWSAVFLQTEEGQFRDATEELFLGDPLPQVNSCFVRFVDFDGDAHLDLCITGAGGGGLFRNNGSAFEDVTRREFGDSPPLPLATKGRFAWADVDGNGSPDFSALSANGFQLWRNEHLFPSDHGSASSSDEPSSSSSPNSESSSASSDGRDDDGDSSSGGRVGLAVWWMELVERPF